MARIKQYYLWKDRLRSDMVRVAALVRAQHLVLAARFVERGWIATRDDYFRLHLAEIAAAIANPAMAATLRQRISEPEGVCA